MTTKGLLSAGLCIVLLSSVLMFSEAFTSNSVGGKRSAKRQGSLSDACQFALEHCDFPIAQRKLRDADAAYDWLNKRKVDY